MTRPSSGIASPTQATLARVLLVDDEQAILDGLRRQLRTKFDITTALGGEEALRIMGSTAPFAVVMSDMRMPRMDGVAFLTAVREKYPDTVRLLLTGQTDMQSTIDAINLGQIHRFLMKPCPASAIEAVLRDAAELHRQTLSERDLVKAARAVVKGRDDASLATVVDSELAQVDGPQAQEPSPAPRHRTLEQRLAEARANGSLSAQSH